MIKLRAGTRRWWWLLVIGALVGAVLGATSSAIAPEPTPTFEATSIVLFDLNRASSSSREAAAQAGLRVTRGAVPLRAAQLLGRTDVEELVRGLSVEVDSDSLSLVIRATNPSDDGASEIADAFTTAFLETSNQQELDNLDEQIALLEQQVETSRRQLEEFDLANPGIVPLTDNSVPLVRERSNLIEEVADLTRQLNETTDRRDSSTGPYSSLGDPTVVPAAAGLLRLPSSRLVRMVLLSGIGVMVAAFVAWVLERTNPRVDTKEEAQEVTLLPVLAVVPHLGRRARRNLEVVDADHFSSGHAEAYRRLRSAIQFVTNQREQPLGAEGQVATAPRGQSFLVVSSSPREGKTSTVAFTAFALAEADVPTLAISADCRRPTLHQRLGATREPGLTELAEYQIDRPGIDDVAQQGPIDDLWVVSSGHPGPLTYDLVEAIDQVTSEATRRGAVVLVDSAPLLATADALELIPLVDHVIFVLRSGRTTHREVHEGLDALRSRGANVIGCVCIGSPSTKRRYSYYESYYLSAADARSAESAGSGPRRPAAPPPAPGVTPTVAPEESGATTTPIPAAPGVARAETKPPPYVPAATQLLPPNDQRSL